MTPGRSDLRSRHRPRRKIGALTTKNLFVSLISHLVNPSLVAFDCVPKTA